MLNKLLKKYAKNEKGLTLIELLVVIVILGIIAAIAVVSIGGIIGDTKEKAKVTEAVQIINAAKLAHASGGKPSGGWSSTASVGSAQGKNDLAEYISDVEDNTWKVDINSNGKYEITNHDAAPIVNGSSATVATEKELTNFIDGN